MADIKQAAKWMREGKKVRRADWEFQDFCLVTVDDGEYPERIEPPEETWEMVFETSDLLADDWEIKDE